MFKIGDEIRTKTTGETGIIINEIKCDNYNDYLISCEGKIDFWYRENQFELATVPKIETAVKEITCQMGVKTEEVANALKKAMQDTPTESATASTNDYTITENPKFKTGDKVLFKGKKYTIKDTDGFYKGSKCLWYEYALEDEKSIVRSVTEKDLKKIDISKRDSKENYWNTINKMAEKQRNKGISKYGYTLEENEKLDTIESITYLQEELIDALMYCEHLKSKIRKLKEI